MSTGSNQIFLKKKVKKTFFDGLMWVGQSLGDMSPKKSGFFSTPSLKQPKKQATFLFSFLLKCPLRPGPLAINVSFF